MGPQVVQSPSIFSFSPPTLPLQSLIATWKSDTTRKANSGRQAVDVWDGGRGKRWQEVAVVSGGLWSEEAEQCWLSPGDAWWLTIKDALPPFLFPANLQFRNLSVSLDVRVSHKIKAIFPTLLNTVAICKCVPRMAWGPYFSSNMVQWDPTVQMEIYFFCIKCCVVFLFDDKNILSRPLSNHNAAFLPEVVTLLVRQRHCFNVKKVFQRHLCVIPQYG